ncbi:DUF3995 domain-containing protein [Actinokineospora sp. NPDC004072]
MMVVVAGIAAVALLLIALLHLVWLVSPWPLRSREELARRVVGVEPDRLPSAGLTVVVAVLLVLAAYLVAARGGLVGAPGPDWLVAVGAGGVAVVLLARGVSGLVGSRGGRTEFARWDLRLYSPLSLGLGALAAAVAGLG